MPIRPFLVLLFTLFLLPVAAHGLSVRLRTGETVSGDVVATDSDGFRLKRWDNGGVLTLLWENLAPEDARRVRKVLTLPEEGEREMIEIVRIQTRNGSFLEGRITEETADKLTLRTREGTKHVPAGSILKRETAEVEALTLYSAKELYDERAKGTSDTDPSGQFDLGSLCVRIGMWSEAEQHFRKAAELDSGMQDKVDQRLASINRKKKEQDALALAKTVRDLLDDRKNKEARASLERLKTEFGDLIAKEDLESLESDLSEAEKGGTASSAKAGDDKIFKDYVSIMSALLKKPAADRQGTFDVAKKYVDLGLHKEIVRELAKRTRMKAEDLEDRWKDRTVSQSRKASYGEGTWVSEGRKLKKLGEGEGLSYEEIQKAEKEDETIQDLWQKDRRPFPQIQEDWWKSASPERRYAWLEAYAAEKLMKVEEILWTKCRTCGGKGLTGKDLCKTCQGVKNDKTIVFR